jgi:hypothetical protein
VLLSVHTTSTIFMCRFERSVNVQVGSTSNIYPPCVVITYGQRLTSYLSASASASSSLSFTASYSTDLTYVPPHHHPPCQSFPTPSLGSHKSLSNACFCYSARSFWLSVTVTFAMTMVIGGAVWIFRFYVSFRRFQLERFDCVVRSSVKYVENCSPPESRQTCVCVFCVLLLCNVSGAFTRHCSWHQYMWRFGLSVPGRD